MFSILLRDLNPAVVAAWRSAFADLADADIAEGSVLDVQTDAIVSPANSFGYMDGGVDLAYCRFFGFEIQERLQTHLHEHHFGELPVGSAVVIETGHHAIPLLISAPTMRVPSSVARSINVYLAFRAALIAALKHNQASPSTPIHSIAVPGMGTGVGEVSPSRAANHMRVAYDSILGKNRGRRRNVGQIWSEHQHLLAPE